MTVTAETASTGKQGATILLVEDEQAMAMMLRDALEAKGYRLWHAASAGEAEALLAEIQVDLILCDLLLPDASGLILCADLKKKADVPIIICSGTKRKDDRLLGFKLGADDFIAKPFELPELLARIEASLRRAAHFRPTPAAPPERERIGNLAIDRARCRVSVAGQAIALTPTEYRLLCALVDRPNEVLSRPDLAERIWGTHDPGIDRSLEVHMRRLRAKLNAGPAPPPALVTLRGFGYQLVHEPEPALPAAS